MSRERISSAELGELLMIFQDKRLETLPSGIMVEHEFTKDFETKMQKLIHRERKPYYTLINTKARVAVLVGIIILTLMTTTVFAFEPLRNKVFEFFINIFEEFSIVMVDDHPYKIGQSTPASILNQYEPDYIPVGYAFSEGNKTEDFIATYYIREDSLDEISLTQCTKQSFMPTIDTEGVATTGIELSNNMKGFYCTNKSVNIMVLHNVDYAFMISSQAELSELIKFAESLRAKK